MTGVTLVFFVDRSLGTADVPDALRRAGAVVEIHDDHFPQDAEDVAWLPVVGERGWLVLTKDARIRRVPLERLALISAKVGAFILTGGEARGVAMGQNLVKALPAMQRIAMKQTRPFIATVAAGGTITIIEGGGRKGAVRK